MAVVVQVLSDADGLVVVKRADRDDAQALEREAKRLQACAHPGVVRVLASGPADEGWVLRLVHGGVPLEAEPPTSAAAVARLAASVATTLADLHERGLVHGRLDARRVLVGPTGDTHLCGFGTDAATRPDGRPAVAADDVAALGAIALQLVDGAPSSSRRDAAGDRALRAIVERARADLPSRRPTARRLAEELGRVTRPAPAVRARPRRGRPIPPAIGFALAVAVVVLAIVALRWPARSPRGPGPAVSTTVMSSASSTTARPPACVATEGRPIGPPDCPLTVTVTGGAVTVDGVRYAVGHEGDHLAVGDWGCEGPAAALLRPSTGEVVVFGPFAADRPLSVTTAVRVDGAVDLAVAATPDGCAALSVRDRSGALTRILSS